MNEKDILGYCPIDNSVWYKDEVKISETHVAEQLHNRRFLCKPEQPDLDSLRIALVTNKGIIKGLSQKYDRIVQSDKVTIFTYHPPIVISSNLSILKAFLLTPGDRIIITMTFPSKLIFQENDIYRPDHRFYIY